MNMSKTNAAQQADDTPGDDLPGLKGDDQAGLATGDNQAGFAAGDDKPSLGVVGK